MTTATIAELLSSTDLPTLENRMLLSHTTGLSHVQLISRGNGSLDDASLAAFNHARARRLSGEPMAYIVGNREFYGRDFAVSPAVLIPRPDTELLIDTILALDLPAQAQVLDMGTGSGAIAVTLACERADWRVVGLDVSGAALAVARDNAAQLGAHVSLFESDWFTTLKGSDARFDLIVSNPPYIERDDVHLSQGDVRFEPRGALTDNADGLSCYRILLNDVAEYLVDGGWCMVEHGFDQALAVRALFEHALLLDVVTLRDLAGHERVTIGRKALDAH